MYGKFDKKTGFGKEIRKDDLRRLFKSLDKDKNGSLTRRELRPLARRIKVDVT